MRDFQIHEANKVNVIDLLKSIGVPFDGEKFDFSEITDMSFEELENISMKVISIMEYIAYRKERIRSLYEKKELEIKNRYAKRFIELKNELEQLSKKVTSSYIEALVESDEEILNIRKSIIEYEAYVAYLNSLYELLNSLHYAIKHILSMRVNTLQNLR